MTTTDSSKGDQAFQLSNDNRKDTWPEMTYAGALSFLRRQYSRELTDVDIVVSGIPYDCATTFRPGARLGPQAIRAASVQLAELDAFPYGFNPFEFLSVVDYGDCFLNPHKPETITDTIEAHASHLLESGAAMLSFGGDHYVAYPILKAHAQKYGPVALVQIDAHCDTWEPQPGGMDHGCMFAQAVNEKIIDVASSTQVGLRTYNDSDFGFEILTAPWIHRNGVQAAINVIVARAADRPLYLSFDIDGLDPSFAPGTGTPVVGGLATWQAIELIQGLRDCNLIGMDVVEVSPPYDQSEITALAAATMAYQWICLLALKKGAKPRYIGRI